MSHPSDTVPAPAGGPVAIFDIDGTWYRWQLFVAWIEMMVELEVLPRIVLVKAEEALEAYRTRQGPWKDFVELQVSSYQSLARLRGVRVQDAEFAAKRVIEKKGRYVHAFPRALHAAAKQAGYYTAALSGSPIEIVQAFCAANGVDYFMGTEHPRVDNVFTGGSPKEWVLDKEAAVQELLNRHQLQKDDAIVIGDSKSDIPMLKHATWPLCMNPCAELKQMARIQGWPVVIEKKDSIFLLCTRGSTASFRECSLSEILPPAVSEPLEDALQKHLT